MARRWIRLAEGLEPRVARTLGLGPRAPSGPCRIRRWGEGWEAEPDVVVRLPRRFALPLPRGELLELVPGRPKVMAILNATPDSFSDGDPRADTGAFVTRGLELAGEGADLLDVGGESTRPGAPEVPVEVEIARTAPVIRGLRRAGLGIPISIDTRKADVAAAALEAGADLVNDVSGLAFDPRLGPVAAGRGAPLVLMHMRGTPATMRSLADYPAWPPLEVALELVLAMERARRAGIRSDRLVLDPGIGFAKDWRASLEVLRRLDAVTGLGRPVLVGASRKSLLAAAAGTGPDPSARLPGSLVLAVEAARRGAAMVRVHDVAATVQALRTREAVELGAGAPDFTRV